MGGGVTRSLAFTLSILALWQAWKALRAGKIRNAIWAAVLLGLTGLCHLEILMVSALFILVAYPFIAPNRRGTQIIAVIGVGSLVVIAPYVLILAGRFGFTVFLSALQAGGVNLAFSLRQLLFGDLTGEYLFTPIFVIALLGLGFALQQRKFLLPALVLVSVLSDPRSLQRSIALPLCLLFGIGLEAVVLPAFKRLSSKVPGSEAAAAARIFPTTLSMVLVSYLVLRAAFTSQLQLQIQEPILRNVQIQDRDAMAWIQANTPPDSKFLVITSPSFWWVNARSEWFPVLSDRRSLTTVQGTEWIPGGVYQQVQKSYGLLSACSFQTELSCLEGIEQQTGETYTHIYLSGNLQDRVSGFGSPLPIEASLRSSPDYRVVYDQDGVVVFERIR